MGRVNIEDYGASSALMRGPSPLFRKPSHLVLSDTGVYNVQSFISALRYAVGTVA